MAASLISLKRLFGNVMVRRFTPLPNPQHVAISPADFPAGEPVFPAVVNMVTTATLLGPGAVGYVQLTVRIQGNNSLVVIPNNQHPVPTP